MKFTRLPLLILFLLYLCFLGYWAWSASQLPERVETHFNGAGQAQWLDEPC